MPSLNDRKFRVLPRTVGVYLHRLPTSIPSIMIVGAVGGDSNVAASLEVVGSSKGRNSRTECASEPNPPRLAPQFNPRNFGTCAFTQICYREELGTLLCSLDRILMIGREFYPQIPVNLTAPSSSRSGQRCYQFVDRRIGLGLLRGWAIDLAQTCIDQPLPVESITRENGTSPYEGELITKCRELIPPHNRRGFSGSPSDLIRA